MIIKLQQIKEDEWPILADMEKRAASPLFHPLEGEKAFRKYLKKSKVFYVLNGEEKIGTISYEPKDDYYEVDGMTILPEYRNKGFARQAFLQLLKEPKIKKKWLLVTHPENTASLLIYLKAGFKIREWKDNYFGDHSPRLLLIKEK